jgi:hypothetical protein
MEDGEKRSQTSRDWPRPTLTLTPNPGPEKETQPLFTFQNTKLVQEPEIKLANSNEDSVGTQNMLICPNL